MLGVGCRGTRSLLTRPYGESSRNRPYRGQAFRGRDKRRAGRKEAQSARTRVTNGLWGAEPQKETNYQVEEVREGGTLKTEEFEITRSNESAGGPDELGVQGNKTRGYLVSGSTWANTPVTRG